MYKYVDIEEAGSNVIPLFTMHGHVVPWVVNNVFASEEGYAATGYYLHPFDVGGIKYYFYHELPAVPSTLNVYRIDGVPLIEHVDYDLIGNRVYLDWFWRYESIIIEADGTKFPASWTPYRLSTEPVADAKRHHFLVPSGDIIEFDGSEAGLHYYYPRLIPRKVSMPPVYYDKFDLVWAPPSRITLYVKARRKRFIIYQTVPYVELDLSHYYAWDGSTFIEHEVSDVLYFRNTGEIKFDDYVPYDEISFKVISVDGIVMNLNINPTNLELLSRTEFMPSFLVGYAMAHDAFIVSVRGFDHHIHYYDFSDIKSELHGITDVFWLCEYRLLNPLKRLMMVKHDVHRRRGGYV